MNGMLIGMLIVVYLIVVLSYCVLSMFCGCATQLDCCTWKNACYLPVNAPADKLHENAMCAALKIGVLAERNAVLIQLEQLVLSGRPADFYGNGF
jgi:hypothetical protein